jgi:hypothetical protein
LPVMELATIYGLIRLAGDLAPAGRQAVIGHIYIYTVGICMLPSHMVLPACSILRMYCLSVGDGFLSLLLYACARAACARARSFSSLIACLRRVWLGSCSHTSPPSQTLSSVSCFVCCFYTFSAVRSSFVVSFELF